MRQLKFRVYIPDHQKFCYFWLNNFDYSDRYLHQYLHPVQQWTGLTDSKGVEIYEGDIVKTIYENDPDFNIGTIIYDVLTGAYRIKALKNLLPIITYRFVDGKPQELLQVVNEVIGNEHELPLN